MHVMQETWVQSLGWEDPLEQEMSIYSIILAWKILWTKELGRIQSTESQRVKHNWVCACVHAHAHTHTNTCKLHPERKRRNKYGGKRTTSTILTEVFYFNFSPLSCFATHLHPLPGWKHFTLDLLKYFLLIAVIQWALHFPFYYLGICLTSLTMF